MAGNQDTAVWLQAQQQLADFERRSSELHLLRDSEQKRLAALTGEVQALQAEKVTLEQKLVGVADKGKHVAAFLEQLQQQAANVLAEGATLSAQLLLVRERQQSTEDQLAKDSCQFEGRVQELRRKLGDYKQFLGAAA